MTNHPPTPETIEAPTVVYLNLHEELILILLNEETGHFRQVPSWTLNCAVIGAVLAELSLRSRIDSDLDALILLDQTPTDNSILDSVLEEISKESSQHNVQYWIERIASRAGELVDETLKHLVDSRFLEYYDGDFFALAPNAWRTDLFGVDADDVASEFIKIRMGKVIFNNQVPSPRDTIITGLANVCGVLQHIFELDDESRARIQLVCQLDLVGRAIATAVEQNRSGPSLQRSVLARSIPAVPLRKILTNPHVRSRNLAALIASISEEYGPIFHIKLPFAKPLMILAGEATNKWANRQGRMHLRTRDYFQGFESVYGAVGLMPGVDGAEHFQWRKAMRPSCSRERLEDRMGDIVANARKHMAKWQIGDTESAVQMCRRLVNAQFSPLHLSIDSQDLIDDLIAFKERAVGVYLARALPKFMLKTPGMRRRERSIDALLERVEKSHTPAQRMGCPVDQADELLDLHHTNPRLLPETNMRFVLSGPLLTSWYTGDQLSFAIYAMATQPELYQQIRDEADAVFAHGIPGPDDLTDSAIDVTRRFIMEVLRMYPVAGVSFRTVMNSCVVEDHEIAQGQRIYLAYAASHYNEELFPDPHTFDIDRYLPGRMEHATPGYSPFGLGAHMCIGFRLVELMLAVNLLMVAYHFQIEVAPKNYKLRFGCFPANKPSKKLKFVVAGKREPLAPDGVSEPRRAVSETPATAG
ncbi:cytochrome P450 [Candidatus Poriferisodalis sp.]|uniref:cytochrome P450 n=1 Tax=Candidatus Poriferisodalis sp. TaxID=3101277 RepID=UPI003B5C3554